MAGISKLLPPGLKITGDFKKLIEAFGIELTRVQNEIKKLPDEVNPMTTDTLLNDWKRLLSLPDSVFSTADRYAVLTKLSFNDIGKQAFIKILNDLGYYVTIEEYREFEAGLSVAGEPVSNGADWVFSFSVITSDVKITYFTVGESTVEAPLQEFDFYALYKTVNALKPAHTNSIIASINTFIRAGMRCGQRIRDFYQ